MPASAACICALRRVPASADAYRIGLTLSLPPLACAQVPVIPWGVVRRWSLRLLCVPASLPQCVIIHILSSSGVWFLLLGGIFHVQM